MKRIITAGEAVQRLQPWLEPLSASIYQGFGAYSEALSCLANALDLPLDIANRTRATILHDLACTHIKENLSDDPRLSMQKGKGYFKVIIEGCVLRIKKLKKTDLSPSNIPTKQTSEFENQGEIPGLPPSLTNLYLGYTVDAAWSRIENVYLLCRKGGIALLHVNIGTGDSQEQLDFTNQPLEPISPPQESRVKVKPGVVPAEVSFYNH